MSTAVTELVIDADTSGADRFSDAMDKASSSASSATAGAAQMTLAIAGVGVAVIAAIAGLRSFIDYVGQQTQQLVDLSDKAAVAGMSVKEFQETLFAARSAGVSDKDFFAGIDKISQDLVQAGQGATEFGRLFEANGLKIKDANGQLIGTKQALTDIMGLVENAAPAVQQRIAAIVGVSASWIPLLKESVEQFEAQKQKAADLGVIIDQSTIDKAQQFNTQWKEAVATWDLQFKASLSSILPLLTQMATMASNILAGIGSASGSIGRFLTPDEDKTKGQLNDQINDAYRLVEILNQLHGDLSGSNLASFKGRNLAGMLGLPEDATIGQAMALLDKLQALYDKPDRLRVTPGPSSTVLPSMNDKDAIDRTTDSIEKQIAKLQADTEAAGAGAGELERLRVEAQLYAAAERAGVSDTEKYAEQFFNLAERAGQAADALARAKISTDIKFGSNTAFLGDNDLAIAQKLKTIYPDVTTALNSAEAAQLRFNDAMRSTTSAIENTLVSGLTDITTGTKSFSQGASDMAVAFAKSIDQMVIKILIVEPLLRQLQALVQASGLLSFSGSGTVPGAIGPTSLNGAPLVTAAHGQVFGFGNVVPFAAGGIPDIVSSPSIAPMAMFGEGGNPEAIVPLARGPDGNLGIRSGGGHAPQVNVTLIESPNAGGQVTQRSNNNGGLDIEIMVGKIAAKSAGTPGAPLNRMLADGFGASQRLAAR